MRFTQPFLRLPIRFDAERLAAEIGALPPTAWMPHPGNYKGNDAVPLVTPGGQITNAFEGPMAPTRHLLQCRYVMEAMAGIGAVWGRSRLMGLAPGAQVPEHVDLNYHWRTHIRIHVPIVTTPKVQFTCGGETIHMAGGECWIFDTFRMHEVHNRGADKRVHLVLDTVGGEHLWDLIEAAQAPGGAGEPELQAPGRVSPDALLFERINAPGIMTAWEVRCHVDFMAEHAGTDGPMAPLFRRLDKFVSSWAALWARFGGSAEGIAACQRLIGEVERDLKAMGGDRLLLPNKAPISLVFHELVAKQAVPAAPAVQPAARPATAAAGSVRRIGL